MINYRLRIEAITCNKLSHCLFDFDCPDFTQYENEKYEHFSTKFQNLYANQDEPKMLSLLDKSFYRDYMKLTYDGNVVNQEEFLRTNIHSKGKSIILPYPKQKEEKKDKFVFRVIFKPESGVVWGFNEFQQNQDLFYKH